MSKPISQREARRWRKRALEAEKLVRNASAIVDQEMERHWVQNWDGVPNFVNAVKLMERIGFRVEVKPILGHTDRLEVFAVRRREP